MVSLPPTDCVNPPYVEHGYVAFSSMKAANFGPDAGFITGGDITYKCHDYYGLVGASTQLCTDTAWSGTRPECLYNRHTEAWFWAVIAILIVTVVLIVIILIFLCCYFCPCCKSCGKGSKNHHGNGSDADSGSDDEGHKRKRKKNKKNKKRKASRSRSRDRSSDKDILV